MMDDFYVGYLRTPLWLVRFLGVILALLLIGDAGASFVLAHWQRDPGPGAWGDDGEVSISGTLEASPYPLIRVAERSDGRPGRTVVLVTEGKFGAVEAARGLDRRMIAARGYPIYRGGFTMLQLSAPLQPSDRPAPPSEPLVALGRHRLQGEIVDSKCFIGAMKPGDGKTHKDCATLCILGGIPPLLLTRDAAGAETVFLLADAKGGAVSEAIRPYIADPVAFDAEIERRGDLNLARLDPASIRRLDP